jgi:hypothetical protein
MVHQTLKDERASGNGSRGNVPHVNAARGAVRSSSRLAYHLLELVGLQSRLLMADLRTSQRHLKFVGLLVIVGAVALLASLPVALIATAEAFRAWGLPIVGAYFAAAGVGLLIAAVALPLAWRFLRRSLEVFGRSAAEFQRNIECIKDMCRPEE